MSSPFLKWLNAILSLCTETCFKQELCTSCSSYSFFRCLSVTSPHVKASDLNPLVYSGVPHTYLSSGLVSISCQPQSGYSHLHPAFPLERKVCVSLIKPGFYLVSQGHIDCFLLLTSAWQKSLPSCSTVFKDRRICSLGTITITCLWSMISTSLVMHVTK